jgi:hypothetical protein
MEKKMSPKKIAVAATTAVCMTLFSFASAQAATHHARHHRHHAVEVAAEGGATAAPLAIGGYYEPSEWGDFECVPSYPGCRPYASKDWSKP